LFHRRLRYHGGVSLPADIQDLLDQLEANTSDARALIEGLSAEQGEWRAEHVTWSVAQCLDHLATGNRVYLVPMREAAARAREQGRLRSRPAKPGLLGGLFVWSLEPPVRQYLKQRAPSTIRPSPTPRLDDAAAAFLVSQAEVVALLRDWADLDLARVRFVNPFVRGVRFSLATGFHVIVSHGRRHLWQARRVRQAAETARQKVP
jgi:hypothetical protein